jgi:hypothetical protein
MNKTQASTDFQEIEKWLDDLPEPYWKISKLEREWDWEYYNSYILGSLDRQVSHSILFQDYVQVCCRTKGLLFKIAYFINICFE